MLNPLMFQSQQSIMFYKQEISKIIDEIIEIDAKIFQQQYKQQQILNQFLTQPMMNQNIMMMQNMQFMQNQFMNPQQILEQKIQLYKEKLGKLNEEKMEKNNKLFLLNMQMNNNGMNQMISPWNNNLINPGMAPINPNQNNFNQMNMNMNMNMVNNPMAFGMFPFIPSSIPETNNIKYKENLIVKVMMEDGKILKVYCNSNDKMKIPIDQFINKAFNSEKKNKDDFDFFIIEEKEVNMNLSVGDNGIIGKNCYIFAKKKKTEEKIELQSLNNLNNDNNEFNNKNNSNDELVINPMIKDNDNNEFNNKNNSNDELVINPMIKGDMINLTFKVTTGLIVNFSIERERSVKEALIMFFHKVDTSPLTAKKNQIIFIYNASRLKLEDNRKIGQIFLSPIIITVVDTKNVIGA